MKKILYTSLFFAGISALFGLCYYTSFKNALLHYNREAVEQNNELLNEILQSSSKSERLLQQIMEYTDSSVATAGQETLRATASYVLETYDVQSQTTNKEELPVPGFMAGITWRELGVYVEKYMNDMPVDEFLDGLVSYEIVSFSADQVVLRKTYDKSKVENQFYMCQRGEFVVVYYSDLRTVYEYTEIRVDHLSEEVRRALAEGFYVRDAQELYSILEGYTS